MKQKHTEGEWTFDATPNADNIIVLEPMNYNLIVSGGRDGNYFEEREIADARLMMAAPKLLAACKALKVCLASLTFANGDPAGFAGGQKVEIRIVESGVMELRAVAPVQSEGFADTIANFERLGV